MKGEGDLPSTGAGVALGLWTRASVLQPVLSCFEDTTRPQAVRKKP